MSPRCALIAVVGMVAIATAAAVSGCLQKLDTSASSQTGRPGDGALVTRVVPTADPIALDPNDETKTTANPCAKTNQDKTDILTAYCAGCHSGPAAVGLPPWDFVLVDGRLVTEVWMREGQPAQRFVIPGDPDHSALYQRMAISGDMPPHPTDVSGPVTPRPSPAENSIIREWILHCVSGARPMGVGGQTGAGGTTGVGGAGGQSATGSAGNPAGSGTTTGAGGNSSDPSRDGDSTGTGGTRLSDGGADTGATSSAGGAGGVSGGGGSGGSRDGGTSDGGLPKCATSVSSGGSCTKGSPSCTLHTHTCECHLLDGKHQWVCP